MELLPEPGSESRFRISVQDLAGARGSGLVGRDLLAPDHPGGPQVLCLLSFQPGRAGALIPVAQ